ncbi:hypothetical protein DLJ53_33420 [Acuticoccus sediminis]|uniref:Uncharacterized protein n=1 Tax=Acuticoccus sediminis TaxID=2184697 RepID=A0A8B2NJW5_9HYPH|nr:hypothetical protein [Acuticoccus sediminis]RAH96050.1 hypothetical protein DLJ53_33420 [Acuticoccus sediminis]
MSTHTRHRGLELFDVIVDEQLMWGWRIAAPDRETAWAIAEARLNLEGLCRAERRSSDACVYAVDPVDPTEDEEGAP